MRRRPSAATVTLCLVTAVVVTAVCGVLAWQSLSRQADDYRRSLKFQQRTLSSRASNINGEWAVQLSLLNVAEPTSTVRGTGVYLARIVDADWKAKTLTLDWLGTSAAGATNASPALQSLEPNIMGQIFIQQGDPPIPVAQDVREFYRAIESNDETGTRYKSSDWWVSTVPNSTFTGAGVRQLIEAPDFRQ